MKMVDEEDIVESEEANAPEFVGRDLLESYIYCINHSPINPLDRYQNLVKSITFGMELLPCYDNDPSENDPKKKRGKQRKTGKN